jgi:hypothetical protein
MLGHLNFVADIVASSGSADSRNYTTFKIRFLAIYQVLRSLRILRDEQAGTLSPRSLTAIDALLQHPAAVNILRDEVRPLRNTLMHYSIDSRLNLSMINTNDFMRSLTAATLGDDRVHEFLAHVDELVPEAAWVMNDWMHTPVTRRAES